MPLLHHIQIEQGIECFLWNRTEPLEVLQSELEQRGLGNKSFAEITSVERRKERMGALLLVEECLQAGRQYGKHANGAPFLSESSLHISVSHTQKLLALCVSPHFPVGIDIERTDRQISPIAPRFLTGEELSFFTTPLQQCMAWSAKEAIYKCLQQEGLDFRANIHLPQSLATSTRNDANKDLVPFTSNMEIHFKCRKYSITLQCLRIDMHSLAVCRLNQII